MKVGAKDPLVWGRAEVAAIGVAQHGGIEMWAADSMKMNITSAKGGSSNPTERRFEKVGINTKTEP